jgi:hypothetical protein
MSLSLCSAEFGGRRWACTVSRQYRPASERLVTAHVSIDSFRTTQACLPSIVSRNLPSYRTSTPTDWQRSHSKYSVKPGPLQGAAAVLHSSFAAGERHRHPDSPTISRSIRPHSAVNMPCNREQTQSLSFDTAVGLSTLQLLGIPARGRLGPSQWLPWQPSTQHDRRPVRALHQSLHCSGKQPPLQLAHPSLGLVKLEFPASHC